MATVALINLLRILSRDPQNIPVCAEQCQWTAWAVNEAV